MQKSSKNLLREKRGVAFSFDDWNWVIIDFPEDFCIPDFEILSKNCGFSFQLPLYTCLDCEAKIRLDEKEAGSTSTVTSQVRLIGQLFRIASFCLIRNSKKNPIEWSLCRIRVQKKMMMNAGVNRVERANMIPVLVNCGMIFRISSSVFIVQLINNFLVCTKLHSSSSDRSSV